MKTNFAKFEKPSFLRTIIFANFEYPVFWKTIILVSDSGNHHSGEKFELLESGPAALSRSLTSAKPNNTLKFQKHFFSNFTSFLGGLAARKTIIFCEAASQGGKPSFLRIIIFANLKYPSKINENHHFCESKKTIICSNRYCSSTT